MNTIVFFTLFSPFSFDIKNSPFVRVRCTLRHAIIGPAAAQDRPQHGKTAMPTTAKSGFALCRLSCPGVPIDMPPHWALRERPSRCAPELCPFFIPLPETPKSIKVHSEIQGFAALLFHIKKPFWRRFSSSGSIIIKNISCGLLTHRLFRITTKIENYKIVYFRQVTLPAFAQLMHGEKNCHCFSLP